MNKNYSLLLVLFAFSLITFAQPNAPGVCMVTVDDSSKHNIIYYDKTAFNLTDSIILYRENTSSGGYDRVMANPQTALSMFMDMDTAGNPNIKLHRYKLQLWTATGGYSPLGQYHSTIYCAQSVSNYNWNFYDIQGTGSGVVTKYMLLRDDNSANAWHPIDSVSGSINNTTDPNVALYPNGQWRLVTQWGITCNPTARYGNAQTQTAVVKSKSNITNNKQAGIKGLQASQINLYPNPAAGKVRLRLNFPQAQATEIKLFNVMGVEVLKLQLPAGKDELEIDLSTLSHGVYVASFTCGHAAVNKRLVIE